MTYTTIYLLKTNPADTVNVEGLLETLAVDSREDPSYNVQYVIQKDPLVSDQFLVAEIWDTQVLYDAQSASPEIYNYIPGLSGMLSTPYDLLS